MHMASVQQVKTYLAYWFQLGRGVWMPGRTTCQKPQQILSDNTYSREFEILWSQLQQPAIAAQSHLDGTDQTIAQLLSTGWDIDPCARCGLPIPLKTQGLPISVYTCPCSDMSNLPNLEFLPPREPVSSQLRLQRICDRLRTEKTDYRSPVTM
jgi:hypothetical protein